MARVFIIADVPDELLQACLQHVRDFDAAHDGCRFQIGIDGPELSLHEMARILVLKPELKFADFFLRKPKQ